MYGSDDDDAGSSSSFREYWLHDCVERGDIAALEQAHNEDSEGFFVSLREIDDMGCTPLHTAILYQSSSSSVVVVDKHDEGGGDDCTRTTTMLEYLWSSFGGSALALGTACNGTTPLLHLCLRMCTFQMHRAAVLAFIHTLLRSEPAFINDAVVEKDDMGNTVFHLAAMSNAAEVFMPLLDAVDGDDGRKSILEVRNRMGERALHVAIKFKSTAMVNALINIGCVDRLALNAYGATVAHMAAGRAYDAGLVLMDTSWKDLLCTDGIGRTPWCVYQETHRHHASNNRSKKTAFLFHPDALEHLPHAGHVRGGLDPPPENFERMKTLVTPGLGVLTTQEFQQDHIEWEFNIPMAGELCLHLSIYIYIYIYTYICKLSLKPGVARVPMFAHVGSR